MKKVLSEGEVVPKGYGLAYWNTFNLTAVFYPFPINHIVRWQRNIWYLIRNSKTPKWEQACLKIRAKLLNEKTNLDHIKNECYQMGYREGRTNALKEFTRALFRKKK